MPRRKYRVKELDNKSTHSGRSITPFKDKGVKQDPFALFSDNYRYYYSDKRHKRRENHLHLMASVFAVREITPYLSYNAVSLFLLISDMQYFELDVLRGRTGWGMKTIAHALEELVSAGYVEGKAPKHEYVIRGDKYVKTKNKWHTTTKFDRVYNNITHRFNQIVDEFKEMEGD